MNRQILTWLESLRAPVAEMAGLPLEAVAIYAQQSVEEHILNAIASCRCAVLLGVTDWESAADKGVSGPPVETTLEVSVWTPQVLTEEGAPTTLDTTEAICAGLHGHSPTAGGALVPQFKRCQMTAEVREEQRWAVGTLTFSARMTLRRNAPPAPAA